MDVRLRLRPALKAHRWGACSLAALALGAAGLLSRASFVHLPFLQESVPVRLLVAVVAVVVAVTPLYPVFTELTPSLVRERALRRARPFGAMGLAVLAYAPSAVGVPHVGTDTVFFIALLVCGLLAIVLTGPLAWAVIIALGFTMLLVDSAPGGPVSTILDQSSLVLMLLGLPGALLLAALLGPKEWKAFS